MKRKVLDAIERPLHGRSVEVEALGELRERGLRGLAPGRDNQPDPVRLDRQQAEYDTQQAMIGREQEYIRRNIAGQNTKQARGRLRI